MAGEKIVRSHPATKFQDECALLVVGRYAFGHDGLTIWRLSSGRLHESPPLRLFGAAITTHKYLAVLAHRAFRRARASLTSCTRSPQREKGKAQLVLGRKEKRRLRE